MLRESHTGASEIIDLVKVEDLAFELIVHTLVHVSRNLGLAKGNKGLNYVVGVGNLVPRTEFIFSLPESCLLCKTLFFDS